MFLSALKNNEPLMQLMNTETPFITDYNQINTDPISMIELLSLPQPAMKTNLNVDSIQEDSLWLKLSSPYIRKLWTGDKRILSNEIFSNDGSSFGNLPDPTIGGTNFLRRQSNKNEKSRTSEDDIEISEMEAKELLGSLLEAMDKSIDGEQQKTSTSKHSFPEAHGEWTKNLFPHRSNIEFKDDKTNEFHQHTENENSNKQTATQQRYHIVTSFQQHPLLYPVRQHLFSQQLVRSILPPQNSCRVWNATNRIMQQVASSMPTANDKGMNTIRGHFQPTHMPYRAEPPKATHVSHQSLNYLPHQLLLSKSAQISQIHTEQMNTFYANFINRKSIENQSSDWKNEAHKIIQPSCPVKCSNPMNMQQYVLSHTDKPQRIGMVEFTKIKEIHTTSTYQSEQDNLPHQLKSTYVMKQRRLRAGVPKFTRKFTQCQTYADLEITSCNYNALQDRTKLHWTQQWIECTDFEAFRASKETCFDSKTEDDIDSLPSQCKDMKLNHAMKLHRGCLRIFPGKYWPNKDHILKYVEMGKVSNCNQKPLLEHCYLFNNDAVFLEHKSLIPNEVRYFSFFRALYKISLKKLKKNSLKRIKIKPDLTKTNTSKVCRNYHNVFRKYHILKQIRTHLKVCANSSSSKIKESLETNSTHLEEMKKGSQEKHKNDSKELKDRHKTEKDSNPICKVNYSSECKSKDMKKRYINPFHLCFEQKSVEEKIKNHIDAQYFNMVADSLIVDRYFKIINEHGNSDMFNASDDKIDGWMHFKITIQEVLRKAADHLLNDRSDYILT